MKAQKGIWQISKGKGDRIYINCNDGTKIMHPHQICDMNGFGIYGYENLIDLAAAILLFEKEKQNNESITNEVNKTKNEEN